MSQLLLRQEQCINLHKFDLDKFETGTQVFGRGIAINLIYSKLDRIFSAADDESITMFLR